MRMRGNQGMIPLCILGATHLMMPPLDWDFSRDGPCSSLPFRVRIKGGLRICSSAWEPTPGELRILNAGGRVILHVLGKQPPVGLEALPAPAHD